MFAKPQVCYASYPEDSHCIQASNIEHPYRPSNRASAPCETQDGLMLIRLAVVFGLALLSLQARKDC